MSFDSDITQKALCAEDSTVAHMVVESLFCSRLQKVSEWM